MNGVNPFRTAYTVGIGDINYGGHMGNDRFLVLFQEARIRYLAALDACEREIGEGTGLIMSEAHVHYRAEAFWGEELEIEVRVSDLQETRFNFEYEVVRPGDGRRVASGFTRMAAFDYGRRRVARLPEEFRRRLSS
jgi:acyl-CoA thioesterase FadM